jgi:hypothetical protein
MLMSVEKLLHWMMRFGQGCPDSLLASLATNFEVSDLIYDHSFR